MVRHKNGLAWIDPAHIVRNGLPPPVFNSIYRRRKRPAADVGRSQVCRCTHTVEIDYTALSLSIPERVEFRYNKLKRG